MRGILLALSGMIGLLAINHPIFSLLFLLLLLFIAIRTKFHRLFPILAIVTLIFSCRMYFVELKNETTLNGTESNIVGKIATIPSIDGDYAAFHISANELIKAEYRLRTYAEKQQFEQLKPGMACSFSGKLMRPQNNQNPGSFNYEQYLKRQNIHWIFQIGKVHRCSDESVTIIDKINRYRQKGLHAVEKLFPQSSAGVTQALIFGERKEIDEVTLDAYQQLGLIHVLVVSGLHVGIILSCLYYLLLRLGMIRENVYFLMLVFLPAYILLTGAAPSVMRAAVMAGAVVCGMLLKEKIHPADSISYAFLLLLFYNPYFLYHIGFQLSFLISFALIVSSHMISTHFTHAFFRLVAYSIVADLVSIPLIMYHFHHIPSISVVANVLFVPLFSAAILPLSFVAFFLAIVFPTAAKPLLSIHEMIIQWIHAVLVQLEKLPFSTIAIGETSPVFTLLLYISIIYVFIQIEKQEKLRFASLKYLFPFLLLLVFQVSQPYLNPFGEVTMIDVGQGDSILIEFPNRKAVYLIDAGGTIQFGEKEPWQAGKNSFDVGKDIIVPVLKAKGIRKLDKVILTHGDEDHIGGMNGILESVRVKEVVYGKNAEFEAKERKLLNRLYKQNVKLTFVSEGTKWKEGKFAFHVLGPEGNEQKTNDRSIILYTSLGNVRWLFMGDAEKEKEQKLIKRYPNLNAEVLKVGHHGSKTSTTNELLQTVNPKVALISVGRNNSYGHPSAEVISRLKDRKVKIYRTDRNGAIRFRFTYKKGYFLQHEKTASE